MCSESEIPPRVFSNVKRSLKDTLLLPLTPHQHLVFGIDPAHLQTFSLHHLSLNLSLLWGLPLTKSV